MAKFTMGVLIDPYKSAKTARLGAGTGAANYLTDKEVNKFVKLAGDSRFDLAAAGDVIEGTIVAVESATLDDYTIGSVKQSGRVAVVLDGLQATPGTGAIAIGDHVVVGTVVAKDTALAEPRAPKVCKATNQPGAVPADLTAAGQQAKNAAYAWRLVSASGSAVASTGVIERVAV